MLYHPSLYFTQLAVGVLLLVSHLIAFVRVESLGLGLRKFPRSRGWGIVLLTLAAGWALWLMMTMDLGEFTPKRPILIAIVPVAYLLTVFFVEEFLAVRALGMVALLVSCVLLDAAFMSNDPARLALVVLAYGWIIGGLFLVGKPYLLRDAIGWLTQKTARLRLAAISGVIYGAVLIGIAAIRF